MLQSCQARIEREIQAAPMGDRGRMETGGWLLTRQRGNDFDVGIFAVTGPGEKAEHGRHSAALSGRALREQLAELRPDPRCCGMWHSHPDSWATEPSDTDIQTWATSGEIEGHAPFARSS